MGFSLKQAKPSPTIELTSLPVILHDMEIEMLHLPALGNGFTDRQ
jgi:hypothetical protein